MTKTHADLVFQACISSQRFIFQEREFMLAISYLVLQEYILRELGSYILRDTPQL